MKDLFPQQYHEYVKRVPLFFPSLRKHLPANGHFNWSLYRQNKEYRALYGTILVWVVLAAKLLLLKQ
jgi:hypothetical protein